MTTIWKKSPDAEVQVLDLDAGDPKAPQHPALYILMRTDMASMNPGKAMAQAAHAANAFGRSIQPLEMVEHWWGESSNGNGWSGRFGTTIVLAVDSETALHDAISEAHLDGFPAEFILDNTYPLRDGKCLHLIPVVTCGYVYTPCRRAHPVPSLSGLGLHP
jgi:peptidyl-tRNA hydrolase